MRKGHWRSRGRVAGATAAALALAAVAAGAGSARTFAPAAQKATTVTLSGWTSSGVERTALDKTIAAFEASHPSIKVDYQPINGDYPTAMLAKFSAHKPPDVFYADSGTQFKDWAKLGALQPLDGYIKSSKFSLKPFFPRLLNAFRYKGHIYGLPKDWSSLGMETNNAIFKKAKLKPPKTWAQLRYVATRLRNGGFVKGAYPLCLDPDWARLTAFVLENKTDIMNASRTRATVNTRAVKQAVNFYMSFVNKGLAAPHDKLGAGWCGEAFGKQRAAIIFEGPWVVPYMSQNFPKVGYTVSRMPKGKVNATLGFTVSYSMARDSQNKQAAWTLLSWLTGKTGMRVWTGGGIANPSRRDVAVPPGKGNGVFVGQGPVAHAWSYIPGFNTVYNTANNELQAVFQHKESVGTMLRKVQSAFNSALSS